jgi:hypothetical protein
LKLEVSLYIHENLYTQVDFFTSQSSAFISWICPLLKSQLHIENQYIYFEGDELTDIYFLVKGRTGFVLPKYNNANYIEVTNGSHFGLIDIHGSVLKAKIDIDSWMARKEILHR